MTGIFPPFNSSYLDLTKEKQHHKITGLSDWAANLQEREEKKGGGVGCLRPWALLLGLITSNYKGRWLWGNELSGWSLCIPAMFKIPVMLSCHQGATSYERELVLNIKFFFFCFFNLFCQNVQNYFVLEKLLLEVLPARLVLISSPQELFNWVWMWRSSTCSSASLVSSRTFSTVGLHLGVIIIIKQYKSSSDT